MCVYMLYNAGGKKKIELQSEKPYTKFYTQLSFQQGDFMYLISIIFYH